MRVDPQNPQINISKIVVGGGIAGVFFALSGMLIFLIGIPMIRYAFPAAIILGCGVALVLHFKKHKNPYASWILSDPKK